MAQWQSKLHYKCKFRDWKRKKERNQFQAMPEIYVNKVTYAKLAQNYKKVFTLWKLRIKILFTNYLQVSGLQKSR